MRDDLLTWLSVRERVGWAEIARPGGGPVRGGRDGVVDFVRTDVAARDPERAARLLTAFDRVRGAADRGGRLTYELLADWQRQVLASPEVGFRTGPAYAKGGRERYGLAPDTLDRFQRCLGQATEPGVPLAGRAARAYLDVAFFHPFPDGNGRAAMLALYFLLVRDRAVPDLAAPVLRTVRRADDPDGAADLVRLLDVLIAATRRRSGAPPQTGPARPPGTAGRLTPPAGRPAPGSAPAPSPGR
ncbi:MULTISPECIES: Fic family protein [unclassified Micromonospora]|uniref:Fic family protein n=1 Tax=unclassified Micromonospora TaxID=2617518 RepID=UPI002FF284D6